MLSMIIDCYFLIREIGRALNTLSFEICTKMLWFLDKDCLGKGISNYKSIILHIVVGMFLLMLFMKSTSNKVN